MVCIQYTPPPDPTDVECVQSYRYYLANEYLNQLELVQCHEVLLLLINYITNILWVVLKDPLIDLATKVPYLGP